MCGNVVCTGVSVWCEVVCLCLCVQLGDLRLIPDKCNKELMVCQCGVQWCVCVCVVCLCGVKWYVCVMWRGVSVYMCVQLGDLRLIPDKCNKELTELTQQLDALNADKLKEEAHLKEVMDSFKLETEVSHKTYFYKLSFVTWSLTVSAPAICFFKLTYGASPAAWLIDWLSLSLPVSLSVYHCHCDTLVERCGYTGGTVCYWCDFPLVQHFLLSVSLTSTVPQNSRKASTGAVTNWSRGSCPRFTGWFQIQKLEKIAVHLKCWYCHLCCKLLLFVI